MGGFKGPLFWFMLGFGCLSVLGGQHPNAENTVLDVFLHLMLKVLKTGKSAKNGGNTPYLSDRVVLTIEQASATANNLLVSHASQPSCC